MLKLTKKRGLRAHGHEALAEHAEQGACSAKDVADAYRIPQEALAKILHAWSRPACSIRSMERTAATPWLAIRDDFAFEVIRAIDGHFSSLHV